ncbi:hypothetical protein PVAP13_7NG237917 [Panicum virgatum]|uniref:Uncharacterized protein n=1 Tax=Panicum virgatum TaxID=38727 RepID=A0A8T0PY42_PANVG|nr:hypothetical protein PVAP13_7NG237917 [Panicum virgatum]
MSSGFVHVTHPTWHLSSLFLSQTGGPCTCRITRSHAPVAASPPPAPAAASPPPRPPLRSRSPMELRGGPRGAAPGPRSCATAGPVRARHGGLLPPPLRRLLPELRRWPSAPHPPPCAGAGRRPSPAPSAASAARGRASSPTSFESAAGLLPGELQIGGGPPPPRRASNRRWNRRWARRSSASRARRKQGGAHASLRPPSLAPPVCEPSSSAASRAQARAAPVARRDGSSPTLAAHPRRPCTALQGGGEGSEEDAPPSRPSARPCHHRLARPRPAAPLPRTREGKQGRGARRRRRSRGGAPRRAPDPAQCAAAAPCGHGREGGRGELGHSARVRAQGRPLGGDRAARRRRRSREEREKETWGERVARLATTSQNRCHVIAIPVWFQLEGVFCTVWLVQGCGMSVESNVIARRARHGDVGALGGSSPGSPTLHQRWLRPPVRVLLLRPRRLHRLPWRSALPAAAPFARSRREERAPSGCAAQGFPYR